MEQSAAGYQVAWKLSGADRYQVWQTNGNGEYLGVSIGEVTGSSTALQSAETTFQQDLNSDGWIGIPPRFDIDIDYEGNSAYRSYIDAAAARWEQVITGDLPAFDVPGFGLIDDLLVSVEIRSIDGVGGVLGAAGPDWYRTSSLLPIQGNIVFDSAGVAMMVNGLNAYRQLSGNGSATFVPLETTGGSGTAGVHWSEAVFGNELMTGFISGSSNPLSILTIGSLQDQGYTVNYGAADPYAMPARLQAAALVEASGASSTAASRDPSVQWFGVLAKLGFDPIMHSHDHDDEDEPFATA